MMLNKKVKEDLCPICGKSVDFSSLEKKWHKLGRESKCPKCGKGILFYRTAKNLVPDGDKGTLKKRFNGRSK